MIKSTASLETFIYFVRCDEQILRIGSNIFPISILNRLVEKHGIVIWEAQGAFKLISTPILFNMILSYNTAQQLKKEYPRTRGLNDLRTIDWNQGISIPSAAVESLLLTAHNSSDDFINTDSTPDTPGKD